MPRSRVSELPQKSIRTLGDRRAPSQLRTSSSDSDPLHHRHITDRSPKVGDRRSPSGSQSDPVNQKKLGTRIAGLESQLQQAQVELKILKDQLASAEAAKQEAQQELNKRISKPKKEAQQELDNENPTEPDNQEFEVEVLEKHSHPNETQQSNKTDENVDDDQEETDVFEVPVEKVPKVELIQRTEEEEELNAKLVSLKTESPAIAETEIPLADQLASKNDEIDLLKANMEAKEKEREALSQENETLNAKLNDTMSEISSAQIKEEEMQIRINQLRQELETSKNNVAQFQLHEKLEAVEGSKEALETEMKKLRVQTEQWRKAADAAAAVLAGGVEMNGRRISQRCGSMDKNYGLAYEAPAVGGYAGFVGSPVLGEHDFDDGFGGAKRKGSGIKMFGDLWKKKSQK